ncbi:YcaO-like family protein [Nonomuraea candida]|uniref:YcaO-like family protein n=1 Tax=Nonomuraea candida TaxID=359159 RepID=UPI0005BE3A03|nr:YcaO-like family protein [Nonomuraea candida]
MNSGIAKAVLDGTHRVRSPEETWEWIRPKLRRLGITRVADVTWLDEIGIPVFQAVRPNALTLSVSQGKGISPILARVSAVMESVELWHAEHPRPTAHTVATIGEMEHELPYQVSDLPRAERHCLNSDTRLAWRRADRVDGGASTFIPADLVRLDGRVKARWHPPQFHATSNGLASGNVLGEALLHGMYEVVERDSLARENRAGRPSPIDLATVGNAYVGVLLELFHAAQVQVVVRHFANPYGIPTFDAQIWNVSFPVVFRGVGTHLDAGVALSRALTEAAQSRVTAIAGARDDIGGSLYRNARAFGIRRSSWRVADSHDHPPISFESIESLRLPDLDAEVAEVAGRIRDVTGCFPLYVDLTQSDIGVPVAHVVCPGTRFDPGR